MYPEINKVCDSLYKKASSIPEGRKIVLQKLSTTVQKMRSDGQMVELLFVCTHNSRRSHFGQIWAAVAAHYFGINDVSTFSAGTEVTALHPNVLNALRIQGFQISTSEHTSSNRKYNVSFGNDLHLTCFSKLVTDASNPTKGFTAIMTCSDAELNCPIVPGANQRIAITYEDPKIFDGTADEGHAYLNRSDQIATEMLYVFSQITTP